MADEILRRDQNFVTVLGGVTDDSNQSVTMLRVDPTTKRLLVSTTGLGSGTVTSITQGVGILLTPSPITTVGSVALSTAIQPIATLGSALQSIRVNAGVTALEYYTPSTATGTVTSIIIAAANGLAGTSDGNAATPTLTLSTSITGILKGNGTAISAATAGTDYVTASSTNTFTNKTYDTAGSGNSFSINGVAVTANTGTGAVARASSPAFTTPTLGVALATSINGNTFTTGTYTLTGTAGKTLNFTNTLTLSGTDSTTMTFPSTTATIARTDAAQTFTGTQTFSQVNLTANAITASTNAATVPITSGRNIVTNNSAATLTVTLTTGAINMQTCVVQILDFSAVAQTITWVNTENSTITAPVTSNGSTTLPLTIGFIYNSATSKWRCVASA